MATHKKVELEVIKTSFYFGTEDSDFYFKDNEGNIYHWNTRSEKAFEEMKEGTKHICTFVNLGMYSLFYGEIVNTIKNVRF